MAAPALNPSRKKDWPAPKQGNPLAKKKRGGQPGNQNARKQGIFSFHQPSALGKLRDQIKSLQNRLRKEPSSIEQVFAESERLWKELESLEVQDGLTLGLHKLAMKLIALSTTVKTSYLPAILRQRTLADLAHDPFGWFEADYRRWGIERDADSFFFVSEKSARNSPLSQFLPASALPQRPVFWDAVGVPSYATSLTDEQWAVLAPLIPPDPYEDWLLGEPPVLIAANRWRFTRHESGEFSDFVAMQNYYEVLQRHPALLAPPRPAVKRRGRPRSQESPRALLDAILWKLSTGHPWKELPDEFPSARKCAKYYRRLFLSGRLYTLLYALYQHLRLEALVDIGDLLDQGVFTTTPSQHIALAPGAPATWQNYTALLFMQLARDAFLRLEREKHLEQKHFPLTPVLRGEGSLSTGRLGPAPSDSPEPGFPPVEKSAAGKKWRAIEEDRALQAREVRKRIGASKAGKVSR